MQSTLPVRMTISVFRTLLEKSWEFAVIDLMEAVWHVHNLFGIPEINFLKMGCVLLWLVLFLKVQGEDVEGELVLASSL